MKKICFLIFMFTLGWGACLDGTYEDSCGNCWMPYCYNTSSHEVLYDLEESECDGATQMWVTPGDPGDPYFDNYSTKF